MSFAVDDFHDLIRLLEEHPEWKGDLRRVLFPDEIWGLPATVQVLVDQVGKLAEAQERTEARLEALIERVDSLALAQERTEARLEALIERVDSLALAQERTEARLEALIERVDSLALAQERTEARLEALIERVDSLALAQERTERQVAGLAEAQKRTEARLEALVDSVDRLVRLVTVMEGKVSTLDGFALEERYHRHPAGYFGSIIRRIRVLNDEDLADLLEPAVADGRITVREFDEIRLADMIARGKTHSEGEEVYLVAEISWGVGVSDVQRASRRARSLAKIGVSTIPLVAGKSVIPDAEQAAAAMDVWQVANGSVLPPPGRKTISSDG